MLVFNKRRIVFLTMSIITPIMIFTIQTTSQKLNKNKASIETMSVPVTSKTIVLDAGHRRRRWTELLINLKNNIDLLQEIKCFQALYFFILIERGNLWMTKDAEK